MQTGVIHVATIAAAVGAVALIALIGSGVVWPLGGFLATLVYLFGSGVGMALHERKALGADSPPSHD